MGQIVSCGTMEERDFEMTAAAVLWMLNGRMEGWKGFVLFLGVQL